MAYIAVTDIDHGTGEGETYYCEAGSALEESHFDGDQIDHLKEIGAIVESKAVEEVEDLRRQIAELQQKLASQQSDAAGMDNMVSGQRAVDQTAIDPQHGVPAGEIVDQPEGMTADGTDSTDKKPTQTPRMRTETTQGKEQVQETTPPKTTPTK